MGLKVALLGAGMVSRVHLEALLAHPFVDTVSLAEMDHQRLEQMRARYPLERCVSDYRSLLYRKDIDLVDICLPHDMHYPVALEAFAAGKHVILEKPISNTLAEADEMIAEASECGVRLYVALNERFLPVHQRVKKLLQEGVIGSPVLASLTIAGSELERMQQPGNWKGMLGRAGGGALADSGTHAVDLALNWFGLPVSVSCTLGKYVVRPVNKGDDTAVLTLRYPGMTVTILVTYAAAGQPWSEQRDIWGVDGSIHVKVEAQEPISVWHKGNLLSQVLAHNPASWWSDSVCLGVKHALDCFASDEPFDVNPEDAREVLRVIRAGYWSAQRRREVEINSQVPQNFS